jgi:hypothetical protein
VFSFGFGSLTQLSAEELGCHRLVLFRLAVLESFPACLAPYLKMIVNAQ